MLMNSSHMQLSWNSTQWQIKQQSLDKQGGKKINQKYNSQRKIPKQFYILSAAKGVHSLIYYMIVE